MVDVSDECDFLVVGGGIAGAAAGYFLSRYGRVTLLEADPAVGMHATGRSAALFSEYFGNTVVRALTEASRAFFETPPDGPGGEPLMTPRGVLAFGTPETAEEFDEARRTGAAAQRPVVEVSRAEALRLCPALRPGCFDRALYKPGVCDIDVHAVQQAFLRGVRATGGRVVTRARVRGLARWGGRWRAETHEAGGALGTHVAPVVVNAAGAWADRVAESAGVAPVGLRSSRRTAAFVKVPAGRNTAQWPLLTDVADTFYAKPEAGGLLLSPADATPAEPGRVRPDDLDVALAIERFHAAVTLRVSSVGRSWAGLRTSVADDTPVIGPAPDAPGFFWLAGLGGYGIQTAPAAGELLAALVTGSETPAGTGEFTPALAPGRALAAPCR